MRKIDFLGTTNKDWWEFKNHIQVIKDYAPIEAKESYRGDLEQLSDGDRSQE